MKCIVIDDEPLAREGMELNIKELQFLELCAMFSSALKASDFILSNDIELIFLDIEMPGLNGLEFLKGLKSNPLVILTTAYPQYALEAFELDVIDYLVKPIRFERFFKAVSKAKEIYELRTKPKTDIEIKPDRDFIYIKSERKIVKIFYREIKYIKGLKDYVIIFCEDSKFITAMNIKTILSQLPKQIFARVSKSYIINVNQMSSVDVDVIVIQNEEIPLGNSFKKEFYKNYIDANLIKRNPNKKNNNNS